MVFELMGKIALITGGASGIGLKYAKELLQNGVQGVTLADVDPKFGQAALDQIEKEFGANRAIFVKTDVTDIRQFEEAFKKTVEAFKSVDILFNNAGIMNDAIWQKEILINMNGVIHGMLLGLDNYLEKYKQGPEALIVNLSSIAGVNAVGALPVYCGTKAAVIAMTRSWGIPLHYNRSKVRVIAICPGATSTPLMSDISGRNLGPNYEQWLDEHLEAQPYQTPEYLAKETMSVITSSPNGAIWIIDGGEPAYQYIVPDKKTTMKK